MTSDTFWRWIGWIVGAALAGHWAYNAFIVQPEKARARSAARQSEESQRFRDWAYVAKEKTREDVRACRTQEK